MRLIEPRTNLETAAAGGASQVGFRFLWVLKSALLDPKPSVHPHVAHKVWRNLTICHGGSLITAGQRGKHTLALIDNSRALACLSESKYQPTVAFYTGEQRSSCYEGIDTITKQYKVIQW